MIFFGPLLCNLFWTPFLNSMVAKISRSWRILSILGPLAFSKSHSSYWATGYRSLQQLQDLSTGSLSWVSLWVMTWCEFELATTHLPQAFPQPVVKSHITVYSRIQWQSKATTYFPKSQACQRLFGSRGSSHGHHNCFGGTINPCNYPVISQFSCRQGYNHIHGPASEWLYRYCRKLRNSQTLMFLPFNAAHVGHERTNCATSYENYSCIYMSLDIERRMIFLIRHIIYWKSSNDV